MRRGRIEIVVILFYIFAMIAFRIGKAEQALFQYRVFLIPECKCETNSLAAIAKTQQPIFIPSVSFRPRMIERKIIPGAAVGTVVFPHRTPRTFAHVWSPAFPENPAFLIFLQPLSFRVHIFLDATN